MGLMVIEQFNDSRPSFAEIAAVIARAKELAQADFRRQVAAALPAPPAPRPALIYQSEDSPVHVTLADLERVALPPASARPALAYQPGEVVNPATGNRIAVRRMPPGS
jgi:hypothetical protein